MRFYYWRVGATLVAFGYAAWCQKCNHNRIKKSQNASTCQLNWSLVFSFFFSLFFGCMVCSPEGGHLLLPTSAASVSVSCVDRKNKKITWAFKKIFRPTKCFCLLFAVQIINHIFSLQINCVSCAPTSVARTDQLTNLAACELMIKKLSSSRFNLPLDGSLGETCSKIV